MDFDERMRKAIQRGHRAGDSERAREQAAALSEEERRTRHGQLRLQLSEQIENGLKRIPAHFPGFQYETIYGERGWGGACNRDDLRIAQGKRLSEFSRIELTVRPWSNLSVVELTAKGTIRNKEIFNRSHYEAVQEADPERFIELIDRWILEYAEKFAASRT